MASAESLTPLRENPDNLRPLGNKSVLLDSQLEIAVEKEKVIAENFDIDMDRLIVN